MNITAIIITAIICLSCCYIATLNYKETKRYNSMSPWERMREILSSNKSDEEDS